MTEVKLSSRDSRLLHLRFRETAMSWGAVVKRATVEFFDDDCPLQAAALSYYTIFSLPPLLGIVLAVAGRFFGNASVQTRVETQVRDLAGPRAAEQVTAIITSANLSNDGNVLFAVIGVLALVLSATTAFAQLQAALNTAWNVKADPRRSQVTHFVVKRLISFGMVLGIAFLTLVSLLLSALLAAFSDFLNRQMPLGLSSAVLEAMNIGIAYVVLTALFAAMYKYLPDALTEWSDAMVGGLVTAVLFTLGKAGIGLYLGNSDITTAYGAAGSLAVLLLWTYYSSMILLWGAEFTQVWSQRQGQAVQPEAGAVLRDEAEEREKAEARERAKDEARATDPPT